MSSYISSNLGPSPFLTSSHHHFHNSNYSSSTHPHYSTNSYTSTPTYLAAYAIPTPACQEKYFPKDMINVLPGVTNLTSEDEEKLIHPLNTYSGNVFSTHRINSPFSRGEIYHGIKDPMISSVSQSSSVSTLIDNLGSESYLISKKDNPFNKKYLLSQKNKQLENYALYSPIDSYELSEYNINKKKAISRNVNKFSTRRDPTFNSQDIADQILQMTSKQNININNRDQYRKYSQNQSQYRQASNYLDKNPFETHILGKNYQDQYLVESDVDEKQFGSFGQGKQPNNSLQIQNYKNYKSYQNSRQNLRTKGNDHAESIIVGLTKIVNNENQKLKSKNMTKREPVFIDSEDEERKSGTFMVPNAIIEEINNPRIPSTIMKKKENQSIVSHQKSERQNEKQKRKYSKQEAIQVGKNPPSRITMRGKTFEKISL